MDLATIASASPYDDRSFVAEPLLDGDQANVRLIRLRPGQALPPHTHGPSELMLHVVEGDATLATADGDVAFGAGAVACYRRGEELRVRNDGSAGVTLLAFLTPPFPPVEAS